MPDFSMSNLAVAFSITLAAGLFTVLGSGLVMFSKTPNPRVLSFGLAFAGGAMVYVSLTEIFSKSSEAFAEIYDKDHAFAITAHNFPEGLATFFATLENPGVGMPLALAIAIHNIPEGISIAAPVYFATRSRKKTVWACLLSGLAEPLGAALGYLILQPFLSPAVFGSVFGVIAGVMVFLALDELLPAAKRYSDGHETVYGLTTGMAVIAVSLVLFHF